MNIKNNYLLAGVIMSLVMIIFAGCTSKAESTPAYQEPPKEMIPGYIPDGFELDSSHEMSFDKDGRDPSSYHSPLGNSIMSLHYENGDEIICINASDFPGGTLESWLEIYQSTPFDDCECLPRRGGEELSISNRSPEIVEEQMIGDTPVVVLEGPIGWAVAFVHNDQFWLVEGTVSLKELLKVVESLL